MTINNLLPGRTRPTASARSSPRDARGQRRAVRSRAWPRPSAAEVAGRFGTADEFGAACAFLCSAHAGFITGQNLLLDGGYYPGTL